MLTVYVFDMRAGRAFVLGDYVEILMYLPALYAIVPAVDYSAKIGSYFRKKNFLIGFPLAMICSAIVGVGAAIAFIVFLLLIVSLVSPPWDFSEWRELLQTFSFQDFPFGALKVMLAVSITFTWLITIPVLFAGSDSN